MALPRLSSWTCFMDCKLCGARIENDDGMVTYEDGKRAHEECDDAEEFRRANRYELQEHEMEKGMDQ